MICGHNFSRRGGWSCSENSCPRGRALAAECDPLDTWSHRERVTTRCGRQCAGNRRAGDRAVCGPQSSAAEYDLTRIIHEPSAATADTPLHRAVSALRRSTYRREYGLQPSRLRAPVSQASARFRDPPSWITRAKCWQWRMRHEEVRSIPERFLKSHRIIERFWLQPQVQTIPLDRASGSA
jgi:hypothetical protein